MADFRLKWLFSNENGLYGGHMKVYHRGKNIIGTGELFFDFFPENAPLRSKFCVDDDLKVKLNLRARENALFKKVVFWA